MSGDRMRLIGWHPARRGARCGFADVELPKLGLRFFGCAVFEKAGRRWASLPARPLNTADGKTTYEPAAAWTDARLRAAFSERLVEMVAAADPDAFEAVLDLAAAPAGLLPGAGA